MSDGADSKLARRGTTALRRPRATYMRVRQEARFGADQAAGPGNR